MTFDKAYCEELRETITSYKARREFFSKDDNEKFHFTCPDENCRTELTGVNIFTVGKFKHRPHFRTKKNYEHTKDCKIIDEITIPIKEGESEERKVHGTKATKHPDEFILSRPKQESDAKAIKEYDEEDDFAREEKTIQRKRTGKDDEYVKPHRTSYLENVVDSFENMKEEELSKTFITLNKDRRNYKRTFKNIKYAEDGTNFIFYGEINPIKKYGNNYAISFKEKIWFNDEKPRMVSIYITEDLIEKYRLRRLFKKTIEHLIEFGEKYKSSRCYFVGAYPEEKTIEGKNGSFNVLNIYLENLDHLVVKFSE